MCLLHKSTISENKKIINTSHSASLGAVHPARCWCACSHHMAFHSSWHLGFCFSSLTHVLTQNSNKEVSPSSACHVRHHTPNKELHFHQFRGTAAIDSNRLASLQAKMDLRASVAKATGHAQISVVSETAHLQAHWSTQSSAPAIQGGPRKEVWQLRGAPGSPLTSVY